MAKYRIGWAAATAVEQSPNFWRIKTVRRLPDGADEADRIGATYSSGVFDLTDEQQALVMPGSLINPDNAGVVIKADPAGGYRLDTVRHFVEDNAPMAFTGWGKQMLEYQGHYPSDVINKGLDFLHYGEIGHAIVSLDATYTSVWRIGFSGGFLRGAANVTNPDEFFEIASTLDAPTGPISWRSLDASSPSASLDLGNVVPVPGALPAGVLAHRYATWTNLIQES